MTARFFWKPRSAGHLTRVAFLSAIGIALYVVESLVPGPAPFLKIGLANISSVLAIMTLAPSDVFLVVGTRVIVGSILVGSLFSPAFLIALGSGVAAAGAMWAARLTGTAFSVVGVSLIGSVTHVVTQVLLVMALFVRDTSILVLLPLLLISATIGGLVVGFIALKLLPVIEND
jgi:heptaprenyl diphosphate synthase